MHVVGIDCAKASFDIAIQLPGDKYRTKAKVANTGKGFEEFLAWHAKHAPEAAVGMEAIGIYHEALARHLVEAGLTVFVANPARIKAFGQSEGIRTKNDRTDAKLRALVRRRDDLTEMRRMELNRLEVSNEAVKAGIQTVIDTLDEQIRQVDKAIKDHIDSDPDLRQRQDLLTSIPGIAGISSAQLMAMLGDLSQYTDVRQIVAHAGLNPAQRQSGAYEGRARISRIGDANLRAKLYMPALVGRTHNPVLKAFSSRLGERGKTFKVTICALMRKLLHIIWGVVRSGRPFDPEIALA